MRINDHIKTIRHERNKMHNPIRKITLISANAKQCCDRNTPNGFSNYTNYRDVWNTDISPSFGVLKTIPFGEYTNWFIFLRALTVKNYTCFTQCNWKCGRKRFFKRPMLKRYPPMLSCLVIGSRNFTWSSYAVRSIPWSSKRWGRSSYKKFTNCFMSIVDVGELWSTMLSLSAHFKCVCVLTARLLLFPTYWGGGREIPEGLAVVSRRKQTLRPWGGREIWWHKWVLAMCGRGGLLVHCT